MRKPTIALVAVSLALSLAGRAAAVPRAPRSDSASSSPAARTPAAPSPGTKTESSGSTDLCASLTPAAVSALAGLTLKTSLSVGSDTEARCLYVDGKSMADSTQLVSVSVTEAKYAQQSFQMAKTTTTDATTVPNIGEDAFNSANSLVVLYSDSAVFISDEVHLSLDQREAVAAAAHRLYG